MRCVSWNSPNPNQPAARCLCGSMPLRSITATCSCRMADMANSPCRSSRFRMVRAKLLSWADGVTRWKNGDRVAGTFFQGWQSGPFQREMANTALGGALNGMLAEYVALSEDGVVAIPPHLGFEEAATLPCAALTAWQALVIRGKVSAGETVLLLGTGGVSIFALQFAKMHGARVIITSSSDEKLARAKTLGADETINYRSSPEWEKEVFRLTGEVGVDHVRRSRRRGNIRQIAAFGAVGRPGASRRRRQRLHRRGAARAKSSANWSWCAAFTWAAAPCSKP